MTFKLNQAGMNERERMVSARLYKLAERVRDEAERLTKQLGLSRTGEFADSWYVQEAAQNKLGWEVGNPDHEAWFFEKGVRPHGGHPAILPYRILERASQEWRKR